jgi:hypothetical protein
MTNKRLNSTIAKLVEELHKTDSILSDKYSNFGTKVEAAKRKKYDVEMQKLWKEFTLNPYVVDFVQKVHSKCGDALKQYKQEIIKDINRDISNLKKYIADPNQGSKDFLKLRLENATNKKLVLKTEPSQYSRLTDAQKYYVFSLCDRLVRTL